MVSLTIDGKKVEVEDGKTILEAARSVGIDIPTHCYHTALSNYGGCRLCIVEVNRNGAIQVNTSCTSPVKEGMVVHTSTPRIKKYRKILAELLLSRCPNFSEVQKLVKELGVTETRIRKKNVDCTLCGLCVRMCAERMGPAAIGFMNRGFSRTVGTPFGKLSDVCQTCGACIDLCPTGKIKLEEITENKPIPIPSEFDEGLRSCPPVYILYPQAVPKVASIDKNYCVHMLKDKCGICEVICEAKAINYEQKEETLDLQAGAIILTPGYEKFDVKTKEEYGYEKFKNVVTSLEFERILSASGPFQGHLQRLSDGKEPEKIAFIQCVGSRDFEIDYCSSVCCMYATKEAIIAKEHVGGKLECDIFFMDIRAFGKGFEEYYQRAKKLGVNYIRCRPPSIKEIPQTRNLIVEYLTEDEKKTSREYNLVVLSVGIQPPECAKALKDIFQINLNKFNFCQTSKFSPTESNQDGIYVAGPFTEPKDIPETVMQASAAASKVQSLLSDVRGTLVTSKVYPPEIDVSGLQPRIGVFVCHCGTNIAGVVSVMDVVDYAKTIPSVVFAQNALYMCSGDSCENIKKMLKEHNLNRVVVASCTPRTHEPLFRSVLQEAGLNPYLFEMANIREHCSWAHMHEHEKATQKAKDLVRMAVAKARLLEPLQKGKIAINRSALVIGGGLAGMVSALQIAEQGFEVYLVEKEKELGGNLRRIYYLLNGEKPQEQLKFLIEKIKENSKIHLITSAKVEKIEGSIGNFKTKIIQNHETSAKTYEIEHGVVIVATGAKEYTPKEYLYGQDERVVTQLKLEEHLACNGKLKTEKKKPKTIVMIQCVGSRDEERPYCSRICCTEAIKNGLKLKETSPDINIYILYRDVRTYGFIESYYTKAREKGIRFVRYEEDRKPEVSKNGKGLVVKVFDQISQMPIKIPADLVVLSTGVVAEDENKTVAQLLKVPLTQDNFFLEVHIKLRPVDFATDGVFLCGLAHSSKSIEESIIQAQAASAKAGIVISKDTLELEANISYVVDENCDGCAYCIDPCPYKAITLIEYKFDGSIKKTVQVNESLCKGCGTCMATCPKKGIFVKGFKLEQIGTQVEAALQPA